MNDDDKSFRERVEEIREKRSQRRQEQNISVNETSQTMHQTGFLPAGSDHENFSASHVRIELPDRILTFSNVLIKKSEFNGQHLYGVHGRPENVDPTEVDDTFASQQVDYTTFQASRATIELADETLEFSNVQVSKLVMNGQHQYGIWGAPDRQASPGSSGGGSRQKPDPPAEDDPDTVVWTSAENRSSKSPPETNDTNGINYCPNCSTDLSAIDSPSFCHECGRDLSDLG